MANLMFVAWIAVLAGLLPLMIWGWVRWAKRKQPRTAFSMLSLTGFSLATASALLAVSSLVYAHSIGGFPFYDALLLKIYRWGALISLTGTIFAIGGAWRSSPVRWHALACTVGTLLFWAMAAEGE